MDSLSAPLLLPIRCSLASRSNRVSLGVEAVARKRRALALFESQLRAAPDAAGCSLLSEHTLERFSRPYETLLYAPDV